MKEVHSYTISTFVHYKSSVYPSNEKYYKKYINEEENTEYGEEEVVEKIIIPIVKNEFKDSNIIIDFIKNPIFGFKYSIDYKKLFENLESVRASRVFILDALFSNYSKTLIKLILNKVKKNKKYNIRFFIAPFRNINYDPYLFKSDDIYFNLPLINENNYKTIKELEDNIILKERNLTSDCELVNLFVPTKFTNYSDFLPRSFMHSDHISIITPISILLKNCIGVEIECGNIYHRILLEDFKNISSYIVKDYSYLSDLIKRIENDYETLFENILEECNYFHNTKFKTLFKKEIIVTDEDTN